MKTSNTNREFQPSKKTGLGRIGHYVQLFLGMGLALGMTGCALTEDNIAPAYIPQSNVQQLAGASNVSVNVTMADEREVMVCVGKKLNGYGMEMAPIVATNDVAELTRKAIETELLHRGFVVGTSNTVIVAGELHRFYNEFKSGFFAGDAVAEVSFNIVVKNPAGDIVYDKFVSGQGIEQNIQLTSGDNACLALNAALKNAVETLFDHASFTEAIFKAAHPTETNNVLPNAAPPSK